MKDRKKVFSHAGILALMIMLISPAFAQNIRVQLDGSPLSFGSVPPANVNGRVLVPLRGVFEALGAQVDYQASSRTVLAARGTTTLRLQIGSATAFVNGSPVLLDVPAQVVLGRTLVPLRFVSEAMGAQVAWNPGTQTVSITSLHDNTSPSYPPTTPPTPTTPPYTPPTNQNQMVNGNVISVSTNPPTITIRSDEGTRAYPVTGNAEILLQPQLDSGEQGSASAISLDQINAGEEVAIVLNNYNQAMQIVTMPRMVAVKVRRITGRTMILDDEYGTQVTIGNAINYINKRGQSTNVADVRAGDTVALFIAGQTIYKVSASPIDVQIASGESVQPPYDPPADGNVPRIDSVQQDAVAPLSAGATIHVTVRGTPGLQGSFDISQDVRNQPLREVNSGVYTGSYRVHPNDDILRGFVTARLSASNGYSVTQQSEEPFTIDTKAPLIVSTRPNNGDTVDVAQPNIIIYTDDQGGSGLTPTTLTIRNEGRTYNVDATVAPPQSIRAVVPEALTGLVEVNADVIDNAGNVTRTNFSFIIEANTGPISSIHHNAARALAAGDTLTVDMTAPAGGRASFDLVSQDDPSRVLVQGIPMVEIQARQYRGTYNVLGTRDVGVLMVVGRFRDRNGELTIKNATTPVEIVSKIDTGAATIDNLREGDKVSSPLTIRGSAEPRNTVLVNVTASGVQYFIFPFEQDLGTFKVIANNRGKWQTDPIELPKPNNVNGLKYTITVVQQDANERTSPSTSITVEPR